MDTCAGGRMVSRSHFLPDAVWLQTFWPWHVTGDHASRAGGASLPKSQQLVYVCGLSTHYVSSELSSWSHL
jgi:hypothetical protein